MIKKASIRRILISSIALFLVILSIYLFPQDEIKIPTKTTYKKAMTSAIYLIDKNNYVSRTIINVNSKNKEDLAMELLNALINGSSKNKYLPSGFSSCIPIGTKVYDLKIDNDTLTVNFNELLFENNSSDEKTIELIVYTLTEIDGVKKIKILINGNPVNKLPNTNKMIPEILTRDIGVNNVSLLKKLNNSKEVTAYFMGKNYDETYYIPITFITNDEQDKIEIIINKLTGRDYIDNNLSTYMSANVQLKKYEILENEMSLDFNNIIFNGFQKIDEEVLYGLALSIYDTYGISTVNFEVDDVKINAYALKSS